MSESISRDTFLATVAFGADGLVPAVAQDCKTGAVLMLAWMNRESLEKTLATGDVTYWSRSRKELWTKGATSGHTQKLVEAFVDCDGDALLLKVDQTGPACHTGAAVCFYRKLER
jgi:phosphoribosyl-AMP cyclohydrolase